jgi:tetrahydromethanopterin S-methyltransferase subunit A
MPIKRLMHLLANLFPNSDSGDNPVAVKIFHRMNVVKDFFSAKKFNKNKRWPVVQGNYVVVNPNGQIAVCTLATDTLIKQIAQWNNIAIVGKVYTPNLGIEKIILNSVSNPNIRFLLVCGKDSPVFHTGQALQSLFQYGIDKDKRIINAIGHYPVLRNLAVEKINQFLEQVELVDCLDEKNIEILHQKILELHKMNKKPFSKNSGIEQTEIVSEQAEFTMLKPGGKRIPLDYDHKGFFVITTDSVKKQITVKHYFKDNKPGYLIQGHSAEAILLSLLQNELVSQLSHAGYLGAELNKAETALKLNLKYEQDQSLKNPI